MYPKPNHIPTKPAHHADKKRERHKYHPSTHPPRSLCWQTCAQWGSTCTNQSAAIRREDGGRARGGWLGEKGKVQKQTEVPKKKCANERAVSARGKRGVKTSTHTQGRPRGTPSWGNQSAIITFCYLFPSPPPQGLRTPLPFTFFCVHYSRGGSTDTASSWKDSWRWRRWHPDSESTIWPPSARRRKGSNSQKWIIILTWYIMGAGASDSSF